MSPQWLIARKEAGELLLSGRGLAWLLGASLAMSAFALLLVSSTELSLLDNAQVVYDMLGIATALAALLAMVVGIDAIGGERERNTLIPLLLTPLRRNQIITGKMASIVIAWVALFVVALPYIWSIASTGQNLGAGLLVTVVLGTPVILTFGYYGMWLGAGMAQLVSAYVVGLLTLMVAASPLLLGPALRQSVIGRIFDAINPFSAAVNAYDAVVIDSMSLLSQWPGFIAAFLWLGLTFLLARSRIRHLTV